MLSTVLLFDSSTTRIWKKNIKKVKRLLRQHKKICLSFCLARKIIFASVFFLYKNNFNCRKHVLVTQMFFLKIRILEKTFFYPIGRFFFSLFKKYYIFWWTYQFGKKKKKKTVYSCGLGKKKKTWLKLLWIAVSDLFLGAYWEISSAMSAR